MQFHDTSTTIPGLDDYSQDSVLASQTLTTREAVIGVE